MSPLPRLPVLLGADQQQQQLLQQPLQHSGKHNTAALSLIKPLGRHAAMHSRSAAGGTCPVRKAGGPQQQSAAAAVAPGAAQGELAGAGTASGQGGRQLRSCDAASTKPGSCSSKALVSVEGLLHEAAAQRAALRLRSSDPLPPPGVLLAPAAGLGLGGGPGGAGGNSIIASGVWASHGSTNSSPGIAAPERKLQGGGFQLGGGALLPSLTASGGNLAAKAGALGLGGVGLSSSFASGLSGGGPAQQKRVWQPLLLPPKPAPGSHLGAVGISAEGVGVGGGPDSDAGTAGTGLAARAGSNGVPGVAARASLAAAPALGRPPLPGGRAASVGEAETANGGGGGQWRSHGNAVVAAKDAASRSAPSDPPSSLLVVSSGARAAVDVRRGPALAAAGTAAAQ